MTLTKEQQNCPYCHNYFGRQEPVFIEQDAFGFTRDGMVSIKSLMI